jgi:hypothetical protein
MESWVYTCIYYLEFSKEHMTCRLEMQIASDISLLKDIAYVVGCSSRLRGPLRFTVNDFFRALS